MEDFAQRLHFFGHLVGVLQEASVQVFAAARPGALVTRLEYCAAQVATKVRMFVYYISYGRAAQVCTLFCAHLLKSAAYTFAHSGAEVLSLRPTAGPPTGREEGDTQAPASETEGPSSCSSSMYADGDGCYFYPTVAAQRSPALV